MEQPCVPAPPRPAARWVTVGADASPEARALSPVLTETVALSAALRQEPAVIVRRHDPYLLLGPQDRRLAGLDRIAEWALRQGIPAFVRIGGGTLVIQDEGTIAFGVARPCRDLTTLELNFRELGEGVIRALSRLGIEARFGRAPGSYCEGPWDLVVNGVKIAGVAQAIRGGFALVSGMILVSQDPILTTRRIEALYRLAGRPVSLDAGAVTNLERLLGRRVSLDEVEAALREGFGSLYTLRPSSLDEAEWRAAARLYDARRLTSAGIDVAGIAPGPR